ncbi:MAG: SDR family oxidoreductase [Alphaproteobacteria bacterium]|nr:SDR family oxidoreductase [Alphaproteobacteria bacterium]
MQGKTVVITGATSGIGEVAADRLAHQGARIVFVARDHARGAAMLKHLNAIAGHSDHAAVYGDLSSLSEMRRVAGEIAAMCPKIDVLINNAGAMFARRQLSVDGLELTFALNHLAYFVLTTLLQPKLSGAARIVCTASAAHKGAKLDFDDLQSTKAYSGWGAYGRSKLMNILFTRTLASRLNGSGVTANCLHPGFVNTRFGDNNTGVFGWGLGLAKNIALSPAQGAETLVFLATSAQVAAVSGKYFHKCRVETPSREAQSDADAQRLWQMSEQIAAPALS